MSFTTAVDRFISLWELAGDVSADPVIQEATAALNAGSGVGGNDAGKLFEANKELLTLHELIGHRLFQILLGMHKGRTFFA